VIATLIGGAIWLLVVGGLAWLYVLPSLIAFRRRHRHRPEPEFRHAGHRTAPATIAPLCHDLSRTSPRPP